MIDDDDELSFWRDEPTRQLRRNHPSMRRVQPGSRSHDHTQAIPVVRVARAGQARWRTEDGRWTPRAVRVGVLALAASLAVPITIASGGDEPSKLGAGSGSPAAADVQAADLAATSPAVVTEPGSGAATDNPTTQAADTTEAPASSLEVLSSSNAQAATAVQAPGGVIAPANVVGTAEAVRKLTPPACTTTYTVVAGDYWLRIARNFNVTLDALLTANNASIITTIHPGSVICLPKGATAVAPATTAKPVTTTTVKPQATTTTVKPTTTTTVKPVVYTKAQVTQIIRDVWPDDLEDEAIRIATRESNLVPTAKNFCCYGLFQIYYTVHKSWLAPLGVTSATQLFDPKVNAMAAYALYLRAGGWGPWKL